MEALLTTHRVKSVQIRTWNNSIFVSQTGGQLRCRTGWDQTFIWIAGELKLLNYHFLKLYVDIVDITLTYFHDFQKFWRISKIFKDYDLSFTTTILEFHYVSGLLATLQQARSYQTSAKKWWLFSKHVIGLKDQQLHANQKQKQ